MHNFTRLDARTRIGLAAISAAALVLGLLVYVAT